ncbi:unnamed protein product [Dovyalis caffra]|uniref:Uncharacterized protein n=1 Tax=Dovyalis caffra TaxID=77055 RepID=A0AAV1RF19_9ROSI|nr:unnamed protein product [Dovyalis caffra]
MFPLRAARHPHCGPLAVPRHGRGTRAPLGLTRGPRAGWCLGPRGALASQPGRRACIWRALRMPTATPSRRTPCGGTRGPLRGGSRPPRGGRADPARRLAGPPAGVACHLRAARGPCGGWFAGPCARWASWLAGLPTGRHACRLRARSRTRVRAGRRPLRYACGGPMRGGSRPPACQLSRIPVGGTRTLR